ncbi:LuxR family two component transcriptional regulator [Paraburkholderia caballeronis]|uniref:response regulator transcription factor n=1 Tax=Paraburkholderia caballeronis TaxID=416943 RepID=UPI00106544E5|nr:response regulator transcription factor [Paraburkholderia caballeronis]TDV23830.1 LuxR family two component transcriptional regulator [Paraburkholderia caballeronis]
MIPGRQSQVLVADDHPIVRIAMKQLLESLPGITVSAALSSGRELLQALEHSQPDLIVTDFTMQQANPDEDGLRLVARLRRLYPAIPVVVFTMVTNGAILHQLCRLGAAGVVGKGEDIAALGQVCRRVLAGTPGPLLSPGVAARLSEASGEPSGADAAPDLTAKELEIVRLFAGGSSLTDIARQLNRSLTTVATQKRSAMRKLRVTSNADLVAYARDRGLA